MLDVECFRLTETRARICDGTIDIWIGLFWPGKYANQSIAGSDRPHTLGIGFGAGANGLFDGQRFDVIVVEEIIEPATVKFVGAAAEVWCVIWRRRLIERRTIGMLCRVWTKTDARPLVSSNVLIVGLLHQENG